MARLVNRRVLVVTPDTVGERMAGPAIRAVNLARELARRGLRGDPGVGRRHSRGELDGVAARTPRPTRRPRHHRARPPARRRGRAMASSGGDGRARRVPDRGSSTTCTTRFPTRSWPQPTARPTEQHDDLQLTRIRLKTETALRTGDAFICASERQRDLWLGALGALGRLDHAEHARDPSFRNLIDVVPFGIERRAADHRGACDSRRAPRCRRTLADSSLGRRALELARPADRDPRRLRARANERARAPRLPRRASTERRPRPRRRWPNAPSPSPTSSESRQDRALQRGVGAVRAARSVARRVRHRRLGALRHARGALRLPHAAPRLPVGRASDRDHQRGRPRRARRAGAARCSAARRGRRCVGRDARWAPRRRGRAASHARDASRRCGRVSSGPVSSSRSRGSSQSQAAESSFLDEHGSPASASSTSLARIVVLRRGAAGALETAWKRRPARSARLT